MPQKQPDAALDSPQGRGGVLEWLSVINKFHGRAWPRELQAGLVRVLASSVGSGMSQSSEELLMQGITA